MPCYQTRAPCRCSSKRLTLTLSTARSLEATSQRTLQMLSAMFEKVAIRVENMPVVGKSHDDLFLSPANENIGERPCVNGDRCLANFVAQVRYGVDTKMAFTCKEFLLPTEYIDFKDGKGLPTRKKKCLMCSRYFQSYVYILVRANAIPITMPMPIPMPILTRPLPTSSQARTDPAFKVGESPLGVQVFCNPVTHVPAQRAGDEKDLQEAAKELPTSACAVSTKDGYHPWATLFADEDWMALRSAREGRLGQLMFKPVVK